MKTCKYAKSPYGKIDLEVKSQVIEAELGPWIGQVPKDKYEIEVVEIPFIDYEANQKAMSDDYQAAQDVIKKVSKQTKKNLDLIESTSEIEHNKVKVTIKKK